jgi:hypothetical protein
MLIWLLSRMCGSFCEQRQGKLMPTDFELISEGRKLADELGVQSCAACCWATR